MKFALSLVMATLLTLQSAAAMAGSLYTVTSPDHRTSLSVDADGKDLTFIVKHDGKTVITPSPLGFYSNLGAWDGKGLIVDSYEEKSVSETFRPPVGKASVLEDHYSEGRVHFARANKPYQVNIIVRAYDDGVALRYEIPQQMGVGEFNLMWESTGFYFPSDYDCWGVNFGSNDNSHEGEFDPIKASKIRNFHRFDAPLVCKTGEGQTTFAIAEADKRDYAGAYYSGRGDGGLGVNVSLTRRRDNDPENEFFNVAVHGSSSEGSFLTPWRVVMVGDKPGDLAQSNLITTLGSPSVISDTSWIKPGKAAWDWWNGWAVNVPNPGVNTETYKAYIDFAASMKLDYILIDEGWYAGSSEMPIAADVTLPKPAMNIPEIVKYAENKGIGVWVWLQWKQLDRQMDDALTLYQAWGIKGIKVDFMDRNDQDMVAFYHTLLSKAASHRLMVDLHGAYPPDGLNRTYPNYITQEGVLGAEYNKFSTRITATHNVTLPFTRGILGPMDYTPGGFRSLTPDEFARQRRSLKPYVQTTRGQAIAMYVVYDSPFEMVADSPDAYKNADGSWADGADLLQVVPTSWDETRVLMGDIGEFIVVARRKGEVWYLGAMTNEKPRKLKIPLDFLKEETKLHAHIWQDGIDLNHLIVSDRTVTRHQTIVLDLAASGGSVVKIQ